MTLTSNFIASWTVAILSSQASMISHIFCIFISTMTLWGYIELGVRNWLKCGTPSLEVCWFLFLLSYRISDEKKQKTHEMKSRANRKITSLFTGFKTHTDENAVNGKRSRRRSRSQRKKVGKEGKVVHLTGSDIFSNRKWLPIETSTSSLILDLVTR